MTIATGTQLGPYEILSPLGAGGMGEVYRAHDEALDRDVAIKLQPSDLLGDATARVRLLREARSAAALNHPHICTIYEVSESNGLYAGIRRDPRFQQVIATVRAKAASASR